MIWSENQARGTRKIALTKEVSAKINAIQDSAMQNLDMGSPLFDQILELALPAMCPAAPRTCCEAPERKNGRLSVESKLTETTKTGKT